MEREYIMKERYKIIVSGTRICVYGSYDEHLSEKEVKEDWLSSVADDWGQGMADAFEGRIQITQVYDERDDEGEPPIGELEEEYDT